MRSGGFDSPVARDDPLNHPRPTLIHDLGLVGDHVVELCAALRIRRLYARFCLVSEGVVAIKRSLICFGGDGALGL